MDVVGDVDVVGVVDGVVDIRARVKRYHGRRSGRLDSLTGRTRLEFTGGKG